MMRRKSEPKLSVSSDRSTLPRDSAAYLLFLEGQVAKNLASPQQLHALNERMAALAAAQKAVATRCGELDGKISGSVRLVKIAQAYAEQVSAAVTAEAACAHDQLLRLRWTRNQLRIAALPASMMCSKLYAPFKVHI
jgi:hypothetical protein